MEIWDFLRNNWIAGLILLVIVVIVILLFRAMFKLAIFALVVGGIFMFAFGYTPSEVVNLGKGVFNEASNTYKKNVQPLLEKELEHAEYVIKPDGTFVIKTVSVEIAGTKDSDTVTVRYKDHELNVNVATLGNTIKEQVQMIQSQIPAQ